jgi:hypothetical protein
MNSMIAQASFELSAYFGYIVAGLVLLLGVALGLGDLLRLSPKRIWAIGSVGFRESMRRRVLWVTPLAMLGIIAVTQLSHPFDEQDAIRQTTKYCLFASGIVVVVATLILACTSLPKEIDNRVIYTIVTKPATRLEIVLGKTLGFARTSAAILIVMGLFSYAYLRFNAAQLNSAIVTRLATLPQSDLSRDTLQHYVKEGLLQSRTYGRPIPGEWGDPPGLASYARAPDPGDKYRWIFGNNEQNVLFPCEIPAEIFNHPEAQLTFLLQIAVEQPRALTKREVEFEAPDPSTTTRPSARGGVEKVPGPARISVQVLNEAGYNVVAPQDLMDVRHNAESTAKAADSFINAASVTLEPRTPQQGLKLAVIAVQPKFMQEKLAQVPTMPDGKRRIYLMITGTTLATRYGFGPDALDIKAEIANPNPQPGQSPWIEIPIPRKRADGTPLASLFRGRISASRSQQVRGDSNPDEAPVAVYQFREKDFSVQGDQVPFELRTKVERSDVEASESENATTVEVVLQNRKTGKTLDPVRMTVDTDRPTFFRLPRAGVEGGEFDLQMRCLTQGHYLGLRPSSLAVVASNQSFAFNLLKSLFILWLLSVLVVIISIFCSTFVSWPIAVVLTLVLLLGRWCVTQLGEPASPQQMVTDFFGSNADPVISRVSTDTMRGLNSLLNFMGKVLPDVDQFRVTEEIERGVTIPNAHLVDPMRVLLFFGGPMLVAAYLFLRKKEVAP